MEGRGVAEWAAKRGSGEWAASREAGGGGPVFVTEIIKKWRRFENRRVTSKVLENPFKIVPGTLFNDYGKPRSTFRPVACSPRFWIEPVGCSHRIGRAKTLKLLLCDVSI